MITLSLLHPLHKTPVQHWTFDHEAVIRVGRSSDNHVILYSAVVSRHHVEVLRTDQGWHIKNIGTNGTYLDGKRIDEVPVEDGIIIRLARSGPNIQIHTTPEKRDPLKDLLNSRRRDEPSGPEDLQPVPTALDADDLPYQSTMIGEEDPQP
ncbi:MAG: FHA domain-containing protein [Leptolyngbya sp.]|nr:FHA domain-containing protein [Leptolyngbya sp.]